jgi:hypothetical protein
MATLSARKRRDGVVRRPLRTLTGGPVPAVLAVAVRPRLWPVAVRQAVRLAPAGWWRRAPYLPIPDRDYLRFRLQTQYGDASTPPDPADLVAYLDWCRRFP